MNHQDSRPARRSRSLSSLLTLVLLMLAFSPLLLGASAPLASAQHQQDLDPRLPALGVALVPAVVERGQDYWQLTRVEWQNEEEARGRHHIDVEMLDPQGRRALGAKARVMWSSDSAILTIEDKPLPDYGANFGMYAAGCSYSLEAVGLPSDSLTCLGLGTVERRDWTIHTVFRVTFQRATWGGPLPTTIPTPPPGAWTIQETRVWPNCGLTRVMGVVQDANGRGMAGHRVELTWGAPDAAIYHTPTNSLGQWEFALMDRPHSPGPPGWRITIYDGKGALLVSGHVLTSGPGEGDCSPGGNARNVVEVLVSPQRASAPSPSPVPSFTPPPIWNTPTPPPAPGATQPPERTPTPRIIEPTEPDEPKVGGVISIGDALFICDALAGVAPGAEDDFAIVRCRRSAP